MAGWHCLDACGNLWSTTVYSDKLFVPTPQGDLRVLLDEGEGVCCIAAPIRDVAVIASIGISAPAARFPKEREKEFAQRVVAAAWR